MTETPIYGFSLEVEIVEHPFYEEPNYTELRVPIEIFPQASVMQALTRYLIDSLGHSFSQAGITLGRSPKTVWASYHQTAALQEIDESQISIPIRIFSEGLAPLEALVTYLRESGYRNVEIAHLLDLSPKTTHTAWRRAEVKRNA